MWTDKEVRQSSEKETDLRVDDILQEEIYSDQQYMDIKKQVEKLQDELKSKSMPEELQREIFQVKERASKFYKWWT